MVSIKDNYAVGASQYDKHPYCNLESLGSVMEIATQKYFFKKHKINLKGKSVFDVSCGTGRVSNIFYQHWGANVKASDFSKEMIEHAKKNYPKIEFKVDDATKLNEKDNKYDFVTSSWAINHIKDYKIAISEMARITKQNGYILLNVITPPKKETWVKDKDGNNTYNLSLFNDKNNKPVTMTVFANTKEDYINALNKVANVVDVSEDTINDLEKLNAINKIDSKRFDEQSKNIKINTIILAKKK